MTAREFHATKKVGWSDHYAKRWLERLYKDIFPWLGKLPRSQIGAPMLLLVSDVLGRVVIRPGELQVGVVTAFVGAPVLILLVRRRKASGL